jgi:hypothetical protein
VRPGGRSRRSAPGSPSSGRADRASRPPPPPLGPLTGIIREGHIMLFRDFADTRDLEVVIGEPRGNR